VKKFSALIDEIIIRRHIVEIDALSEEDASSKAVDPSTPTTVAVSRSQAKRKLIHIAEDPTGDLRSQHEWQRRLDGNADAG
jgi:hypothetical protein